MLSRRAVLRAAVAAPLVPLLAACDRGDTDPGNRPLDVLVVGGGLAGLRVLDELTKAGRSARLLEGAERLGGRIYTLRDGFSSGLFAEAGAERVGPQHGRMQALLREFGIGTRSYEFSNPVVFIWNGERHRIDSAEAWPSSVVDRLTELERTGIPDRIQDRIALAAERPAVDDPRNGLQWLRDNGLSAQGEELVRTFCVYPLEQLSASTFRLFAEREAVMDSHGGGVTLEGGSDRVITALAARHRARIETGVRIQRVTQEAEQVVLEDAAGRSHRAPRAVLCLPHQAYDRLACAWGIPEPLRARRAGLEPVDELKVHLEVPGALFSGTGLSEFTLRDSFPRVTWALPAKSPDGAFVLNGMAVGRDLPLVREAVRAGPEALRDLMRASLPAVSRQALSFHSWDFGTDPLGGGAYTIPTKAAPRHGDTLRAGRLWFAGSDLSSLSGWMEGALLSADAAVKEILG